MKLFSVIGIMTCIVVVVAIIMFIGMWIKDELIPEIIYKYRRKHRFDKSPIAKCYCRDCTYWNSSTGACADNYSGRMMSDACFCCFAEPASKEEISKREEGEVK